MGCLTVFTAPVRPSASELAFASIMETILYTRSGCHLCDVAEQILLEHGISPRLVDIDQHEELQEQFNTCVPVVEIDGKVRFRGKVDPVLLRRLLNSNN